MHSDEETFRGTVLVLRRGHGRDARVWLTLNGAWKTTLRMTDTEAALLADLLTEARRQSKE
jgi:hypothetical protein